MEQKLGLSGKFICEIYDRDGNLKESFEIPNVVTKEGKFYLLRAGVVGDISATYQWYMGLIGADVTPSENDTASSALGSSGNYQELTNYSATTRVLYNVVSDANSRSISNVANPASFDATATITVYGVFISSSSTKLSNSGVLLCAGRFTTPKQIASGESLIVRYTIAA